MNDRMPWGDIHGAFLAGFRLGELIGRIYGMAAYDD